MNFWNHKLFGVAIDTGIANYSGITTYFATSFLGIMTCIATNSRMILVSRGPI